MYKLLLMRTHILKFLKQYEIYIIYGAKFLMSFIFINIVTGLGNPSPLSGIFVSLFLALIATILPIEITQVFFILLITAHIFMSSVELSAIVFVFLMLCFLFYGRIFPEQSLLCFAVIIAYMLKIPAAVVLFTGLYIGLPGVMPVLFGVFMSYMLPVLSELLKTTQNTGFDLFSMPENFLSFYVSFFNVLTAKGPWLMDIVIFTIVMVVVNIMSKLPINYNKYLSILGGGIILLIGTIAAGIAVKTNILFSILGILLSLIVIIIITFFDTLADYKKSQKVIFEDDDFIYYVKAVPKALSVNDEAEIEEITNNIKNMLK